ncbi:MAG: hypothetical protein ACI8QC_004403 [Planctomycetota bacterium]|jgi:hypothetical protein
MLSQFQRPEDDHLDRKLVTLVALEESSPLAEIEKKGGGLNPYLSR